MMVMCRQLIHKAIRIELRQIKHLAMLASCAPNETARQMILHMIEKETGEAIFWNTVDAAYRICPPVAVPYPGVAPCPGVGPCPGAPVFGGGMGPGMGMGPDMGFGPCPGIAPGPVMPPGILPPVGPGGTLPPGLPPKLWSEPERDKK